jgi:nitrogenase iron protein NifH
MKKIAFYGKGGIGKSTTVSNVSMAIAEQGYTVMQIGCDPKADSTRNLRHGKPIPSVLSVMREKKCNITLEEIVYTGSGGVLCVEAGGPKPGSGCAGRGIITAFEQLEELRAYEVFQPDIVLYDVLGDVVCGGFALPIRQGYADEICIVTSGEMMSLYAADNIAQAVRNYAKRGYAALKGLVFNAKGIEKEDEIISLAAKEMKTSVLQKINRDSIVQKAEIAGMTVLEYDSASSLAERYRDLGFLLMGEEHG